MRGTTLFIATVVATSVAFGGCQTQTTAPKVTQDQQPNVTLRGSISKLNGKFFLTDDRRVATQLDSTTMQLDSYVGQTVSATGQYSGTTLFVDTVK